MPEAAYTGHTCLLDTWRGAQPSRHRLARITLRVGSVEVVKNVAVVETLDCPALLGSDLGKEFTLALMNHIIDATNYQEHTPQKSCPPLIPCVAPVSASQIVAPVSVGQGEAIRVTRDQSKLNQAELAADEEASEQSEGQPLILSDIFDFPESYFEEEPSPTPVEAWSTLPAVSALEVPLPCLSVCVADREALIVEQQADPSLQSLLALGLQCDRGYCFIQGILVHITEDSLGDTCQRVVVPSGPRTRVLELAHSNRVAGHARLSLHFIWPKVWVDVKSFITSCGGCQRAARYGLHCSPSRAF